MKYGTIRIPREDFDRHNERRKELGLEWVEYLDEESVSVEVESVDYAEIENIVEDTMERVMR